MVKTFSDLELQILEKDCIECDDVALLLGDYTDCDLPSSIRARLDSHIKTCPFCAEMRASYKFTVDLARDLADRPVPTDVQNRLRATLNHRLGLNLPQVR